MKYVEYISYVTIEHEHYNQIWNDNHELISSLQATWNILIHKLIFETLVQTFELNQLTHLQTCNQLQWHSLMSQR